jgi:hypothetical protein
VLIRLRHDGPGGIILQGLNHPVRDLTSVPVAKLVGNFVLNAVPICFSVPTKQGFCHALVELNEPLAESIASRNLQAVQAKLAEAIAFGQQVVTDPN